MQNGVAGGEIGDVAEGFEVARERGRMIGVHVGYYASFYCGDVGRGRHCSE